MKAILIAGAALALALSVGPAWAEPGDPLVPGAGPRSYPNQPLQYGQRDRHRGDWDRGDWDRDDWRDRGRWDFDDRWRHRDDWDRDDWRDRGSYRWDFDDRWRYGDRYRAYRPNYGGYGVYPGYGSYRVTPGPGFGYYIRPYGSSYLYPYGSSYRWRY